MNHGITATERARALILRSSVLLSSLPVENPLRVLSNLIGAGGVIDDEIDELEEEISHLQCEVDELAEEIEYLESFQDRIYDALGLEAGVSPECVIDAVKALVAKAGAAA